MTTVMHHHPMLVAEVGVRQALVYEAGPDAAEDRAPHVRAASGATWLGGRLVMVQDDANFLGLWDPGVGVVTAVPLPRGEGGARLFGDYLGNKAHKLDLEACVTLRVHGEECLMAFGSGSTHARDRLVLWNPAAKGARAEPRFVDARRFYETLRARKDFSGSELNIEGAAIIGTRLLLVQRGNGAVVGEHRAVNATCEVDLAAWLAFVDAPDTAPVPAVEQIEVFDLGEVDGCVLSLTDVLVVGARAYYVAVAEESPDATRDGPVRGVALGILRGPGAGRYAMVREADGSPFLGKIEGLAANPTDPSSFFAVTDGDDPHRPADLLHLTLRGDW